MSRRLSIIIPTLNAASELPHFLDMCRTKIYPLEAEFIIADGDSDDGTVKEAKQFGAVGISASRGRGNQLRKAADKATNEWLLFLHIDSELPDTFAMIFENFIGNDANRQRAGYFRFKLDDDGDKARQLEKKVAWRCRTFALPYGDQGLLIHRNFYETLGGFKAIPLMEDVDLIWRIEKRAGKQAIVELPASVTTSAAKFRRDGYFKRSARNLFCLFLFWIKVPPHLIAKLY